VARLPHDWFFGDEQQKSRVQLSVGCYSQAYADGEGFGNGDRGQKTSTSKGEVSRGGAKGELNGFHKLEKEAATKFVLHLQRLKGGLSKRNKSSTD